MTSGTSAPPSRLKVIRSAATRPWRSAPTARAAMVIISDRLRPCPTPRMQIATTRSVIVSSSGVIAIAAMAATTAAINSQWAANRRESLPTESAAHAAARLDMPIRKPIVPASNPISVNQTP